MTFLEISLLGAGLAVDASCVCTSNGLVYQPKLKNTLKMVIAFALFQFIMPIIGFLGASLLPKAIYSYNNIIAFILLCLIGIKMLIDAKNDRNSENHVNHDHTERDSLFTTKILLVQAVATSIDALSVGFAFIGMDIFDVLNASLIIAIVTFIMCFIFVKIGIYIGDKLNAKAEFLGGIVLIFLAVRMLFH